MLQLLKSHNLLLVVVSVLALSLYDELVHYSCDDDVAEMENMYE